MERWQPEDDADEDGFRSGFDPMLNRPVFVRLLPRSLAGDSEVRERYLRGAQAYARLNHPNIVALYEVAEHQGALYLVCEAMGPSLAAFTRTPLERRSLSNRDRRGVLRQVLDALDYAHQHGVIHRCLCPQNIRLCESHTAKIWGFGIDWLERNYQLGSHSKPPEVCFYFAPEQARGEGVDQRTDIYAVGVLMYQLWTGSLPFQADFIYALVEEQLRGPSLEFSEISEKVASAIHKCLQPDPAQRFQDVYELRNHLFQEESGQVELSPPEAQLHNLLGLDYLKRDKYDLAVIEFQKAIVLDPHNAVHRNNCAVALFHLQNARKAAAELEAAAEGAPTSFAIRFNLGLVYTALERWQEAAQALRAATVMNPKFAPAYLLLARTLVQLEQFHQAIDETQKSLMLSPQSRKAHLLLALCYRQMGRDEQAANHQEMAKELALEPAAQPLTLSE